MERSAENLLPGWFVVEFADKSVLAGHVSETTISGVTFLRVNVPMVGHDGGFDKMVNPQCVSALTPSTEALCRRMIAVRAMKPFTTYPGEAMSDDESYNDHRG